VTGWVCDERRGADLRAAVPSIRSSGYSSRRDAPYSCRETSPEAGAPASEPAFLPRARARGELMQHARGGGARGDFERGAIVRLELAQFLARAALDGLDRGLHALPMRGECDDQAIAVAWSGF
jgi:hypothetical protein